MLHASKFGAGDLDKMLRDCAEVTLETRIKKRRMDISKSRVVIPKDVGRANEDYFGGDVEYFKGVLMDKYGFTELATQTGIVALSPTVNV